GIGTSTDKVVVSANVFRLIPGGGMGCEPDGGPTGFIGSEMDVMAWNELIGSGTINIDFLFSPQNFANNYFAWRPSLQVPASSPTVFAVSRTRSTSDVAYARITGSPAGGGTTTITIATLSAVITGFADPPAPKQPDAP